MAKYSVTNSTNYAAQPNTTTTYTPLIIVAASSGGMVNPPTFTGLRRGKLYDLLLGTNGTPADNAMELVIQRATVGTTVAWVGSISSGSSLFMLDSADGGFSGFVTVNASATSSGLTTITLQQPLWYDGWNQRASYRWVCSPGSELVYPAISSGTGSQGFVVATRSPGYIGTDTVTLWVEEQ